MFDLRKMRGCSKIDYLRSFLNILQIDHYFLEQRRRNVKQLATTKYTRFEKRGAEIIQSYDISYNTIIQAWYLTLEPSI